MKKIAFISGPALGHVGRLQKIAKRLANIASVEITLIVTDRDKYAEPLFGKDANIVVIPSDKDKVKTRAETFADGLAQVFRSTRFDLIVQDISVLEFLVLAEFPDCPRVVVTNTFVTRLANFDTMQTRKMHERAADIARKREERNLPQLASPFDLYEADRVLLADPSLIVQQFGDLPPHYVACGEISWALEDTLPPELEDKQDLLVMSMGTTGRSWFNPKQIEKARQTSGCTHSVYVGSKYEKMQEREVAEFQYEWLPLEQLLSKARLVFSQGGAGSTYQALSKGIPVIVLPDHRNQEILGEILENLGVGICIPKGTPIPKKLKTANFDTLSENARAFAQDMAHEDGAGTAAQEIRSLLSC